VQGLISGDLLFYTFKYTNNCLQNWQINVHKKQCPAKFSVFLPPPPSQTVNVLALGLKDFCPFGKQSTNISAQ
jgi:hypothetical protein